MLALALYAAVIVTRVPPATWRQAKHAADSATAASRPAPPPAWLERIAPGSTRRTAEQRQLPAGVQTAAMGWGVSFAFALFAGLFGTLAWGGGMLLGFAAAGRWPGGDQ